MRKSTHAPKLAFAGGEKRGPALPNLIIARQFEEVLMLDILFIVIALAFLGGAMLYVRACDRL